MNDDDSESDLLTIRILAVPVPMSVFVGVYDLSEVACKTYTPHTLRTICILAIYMVYIYFGYIVFLLSKIGTHTPRTKLK